MRTAVTDAIRARSRLPYRNTWRRRQRSSSTPAKGPTTEYGRSRTAIAEAIAAADVCFSGEKTT
ncbi:hypothetical protein SGRIM128S_08122 [Streptomyces griseomycini]